MRTLRAIRGPGVLRLRMVMITHQHMAFRCDIFVRVKLHFAERVICFPARYTFLPLHISFLALFLIKSLPVVLSSFPSFILCFIALYFYPFHHSLHFSSRSVGSYNPDYLTASAFSITRPGWINIIDHISESPSNWCCVCVQLYVCMNLHVCIS